MLGLKEEVSKKTRGERVKGILGSGNRGKAGSCERSWPVCGKMENAVRLESSMSG